ncbi:MAG TPA: dockerin [Verrucomicrobiae bacterium]|nr:dockerin [Verrucomicrobiae bacterium]
MASIILCAALAGSSKSAAAANLPWDWTGIIGTGQSLSIGARSKAISTNQPYGNLKLSTDHLPWPIDPDNPDLKLVPLVEPIGRLAPRYPSSWPENITGETPHTAMANEISALAEADLGRDYITVQSAVGEDGQGIIYLRKNAPQRGVNGHSYEAAMIETKAITRLAKAAGKTYGVGAIVVTHGETDAGNQNYEAELYQLWQNYNTDLPAITGQTRKIQMLVSQQHSFGDRSPSTLAQWKIGVDHPEYIVCSGPKYQYPYYQDGVHLTAQGYQELGEKYGEVYFERVVLGKHWEPLEPTSVEHNGKTITIHFHVPNPPLVWETSFQPPHRSVDAWKEGKGFEISTTKGDKVTIASVQISGDKVIITCATDPGPSAQVGYATMADGRNIKMMTPYPGTSRWGLLRDSDPFKGVSSKKVQPNYCVAFELTAP